MPGVTTAYQNGVHGSRPAANAGCILYACSTHSLIYRSDGSSWTTWMTIGSSTTTVASDAIWDVAGDLAVGTGADTAAKLPLGAAGGALSRVNGAVAWNSGTSFPTAATGDRYWRTDRGIEYFYDGTRWLSTTLYRDMAVPSDHLMFINTSGWVFGRSATWYNDYDLWLVGYYAYTYVAAPNSGSAYWTIFIETNPGSGAVANFATSADTADVYTGHKGTIGALLGTSITEIGFYANKTAGAPGILGATVALTYRLVG